MHYFHYIKEQSIFFKIHFPRTFNLLIVCLCVALTSILYHEAIYYGMNWDDPLHLVDNIHYQNLKIENLLAFWKQGYFGLYIPITYTLWGLMIWVGNNIFNVQASEMMPFFHSINIIIHSLNSYLVYKVGKYYFKREILSLSLMILFLIHPVHSEVVIWMAEFRGLLSSFFVLIAMQFLMKEDYKASNKIAVTCFFILGVLSKPGAIVFLGIIIIESLRITKSIRKNYVWWLLTFLFGFAPVIYTKIIQSGDQVHYHTQIYERVFIVIQSFQHYITKILIPHDIHHLYSPLPSEVIMNFPYIKVCLFIVCLILPLFIKSFRLRYSLLTFYAIALISVNLGLIDFVFQNFSIVANRYSYLLSIPILIILIDLLCMLYKRSAIVSVVISFAFIAFSINEVILQKNIWKSPHNLWGYETTKNIGNTWVLGQWAGSSQYSLELSYVAYLNNPDNLEMTAKYTKNMIEAGQGQKVDSLLERIKSTKDLKKDSLYFDIMSLRSFNNKEYFAALDYFNKSIGGVFTSRSNCATFFNLFLHYKGKSELLKVLDSCPYSQSIDPLKTFILKVQSLDNEFPDDLDFNNQHLDSLSHQIIIFNEMLFQEQKFELVAKNIENSKNKEIIYHKDVYKMELISLLNSKKFEKFESRFNKYNRYFPEAGEDISLEASRIYMTENLYELAYIKLIRAYLLSKAPESYKNKFLILEPYLENWALKSPTF